jgi:hypothetical protein
MLQTRAFAQAVWLLGIILNLLLIPGFFTTSLCVTSDCFPVHLRSGVLVSPSIAERGAARRQQVSRTSPLTSDLAFTFRFELERTPSVPIASMLRS